jgi:predicted CXXCH cytochrome family protein
MSILERPSKGSWMLVGTIALGLWLSAAVMPVLADGGPHVANQNSGFDTLTADGCAGCHRAHTASGPMLLAAASDRVLCLSCHGMTGQGATTNVEGGVQYAAPNDGTSSGAVAGALRSGGFVTAHIESTHTSRISFPDTRFPTMPVGLSAWVPVKAGATATTSAHMDLDGANGVAMHGTAWGNGALGSGAGPSVQLGCTSCHDPHGNGQYRILRPIPTPAGLVPAPAAAKVTDAPLPTGTGTAATRNYTVQWGRTLADVLSGTYNWENFGTFDAYAGDYWRNVQPWNLVPVPGCFRGGCTLGEGDSPMYVPNDPVNLDGSFRTEITVWCSSCHTRYDASGTPPTNSGDPIYKYRHQTTVTECTQCHVAHGSNALMPGAFSGPMTYPGGSAPTSYTSGSTTTYDNSRLLKIDNRGTCQACHDPTGTILPDNSVISH